MKPDHRHQIELLNKMRRIKGVKKVFIASGIRHDLMLSDKLYGKRYLEEVVQHHVSGQLKIAPEHTEKSVLDIMGKPGTASLLQFKDLFDRMSAEAGKEQYLTYYLIAAHPGCTDADMRKMKQFTSEKLKINPEQVQIFLPAPSTYSGLMYYTGLNHFTRKPVFVEKDLRGKERQKDIITQ